MNALLARLRYFLVDAADEWRTSPGVNVLATVTLASVLFGAGTVLLVTRNVRSRLEDWRRDVRVEVYLQDSASDEARRKIARQLAAEAGVSRVALVTKDEALRRFRESFSGLADLVPELGANPLPASLEAFLVPGPGAAAAAAAIGSALRGVEGVEEVRFDLEWLDRLDSWLRGVRNVGIAAGLAVLAVVVFVIAGVVRLAVHARSEEIEIMLLVGAPPSLVRGPFLVSGLAQGLVASAASLVLVDLSRRALLSWGEAWHGTIVGIVASRPLAGPDSLLVVSVGVLVATAAAWFAVGRQGVKSRR